MDGGAGDQMLFPPPPWLNIPDFSKYVELKGRIDRFSHEIMSVDALGGNFARVTQQTTRDTFEILPPSKSFQRLSSISLHDSEVPIRSGVQESDTSENIQVKEEITENKKYCTTTEATVKESRKPPLTSEFGFSVSVGDALNSWAAAVMDSDSELPNEERAHYSSTNSAEKGDPAIVLATELCPDSRLLMQRDEKKETKISTKNFHDSSLHFQANGDSGLSKCVPEGTIFQDIETKAKVPFQSKTKSNLGGRNEQETRTGRSSKQKVPPPMGSNGPAGIKIRKKRGGKSKKKRNQNGNQSRTGMQVKNAPPVAFVPDCRFWLEGKCLKGSKCVFSHAKEPKTRSELCFFAVSNSCLRGPKDCPFSHDTKKFPCKFHNLSFAELWPGSPVKKFKSDDGTPFGCRDGDNCCYSHAPISAEEKAMLLSRLRGEGKETEQGKPSVLLGESRNAVMKEGQNSGIAAVSSSPYMRENLAPNSSPVIGSFWDSLGGVVVQTGAPKESCLGGSMFAGEVHESRPYEMKEEEVGGFEPFKEVASEVAEEREEGVLKLGVEWRAEKEHSWVGMGRPEEEAERPALFGYGRDSLGHSSSQGTEQPLGQGFEPYSLANGGLEEKVSGGDGPEDKADSEDEFSELDLLLKGSIIQNK